MATVSVGPALARRYGFAVSRKRPELAGADYWAIAETTGGWRAELAFLDDLADPLAWARQAFGLAVNTAPLTITDKATGRQSLALFDGQELVFALFLSPDPVLVSRQWAVSLLTESIKPARRADILVGRPGADRPDPGPIVCACFSVGANQIAEAARGGCHTVDARGAALKAGTNCGSCRADIRGLIELNRLEAAE